MRCLLLVLILSSCSSRISTLEDLARYQESDVAHFNAPFTVTEILNYADTTGIPLEMIYFVDSLALPNRSMFMPTMMVFDGRGELMEYKTCNADYPGALSYFRKHLNQMKRLSNHKLTNELSYIDTNSALPKPTIHSGKDLYVVFYWRLANHRFNRVHMLSMINEIKAAQPDFKVQLFAVNFDNRVNWNWTKEEYKQKRIDRRNIEDHSDKKWVPGVNL